MNTTFFRQQAILDCFHFIVVKLSVLVLVKVFIFPLQDKHIINTTLGYVNKRDKWRTCNVKKISYTQHNLTGNTIFHAHLNTIMRINF